MYILYIHIDIYTVEPVLSHLCSAHQSKSLAVFNPTFRFVWHFPSLPTPSNLTREGLAGELNDFVKLNYELCQKRSVPHFHFSTKGESSPRPPTQIYCDNPTKVTQLFTSKMDHRTIWIRTVYILRSSHPPSISTTIEFGSSSYFTFI